MGDLGGRLGGTWWLMGRRGGGGVVGNQEELQSPSLHSGADSGAVHSWDNWGGRGGGKTRCPLWPCLVQ